MTREEEKKSRIKLKQKLCEGGKTAGRQLVKMRSSRNSVCPMACNSCDCNIESISREFSTSLFAFSHSVSCMDTRGGSGRRGSRPLFLKRNTESLGVLAPEAVRHQVHPTTSHSVGAFFHAANNYSFLNIILA